MKSTYSLLASTLFSIIIITSPQSPPQVVQTYLQPCRWSLGSWPHLNKVVFATRPLFDDAACYHSQKSSQPGDSSRSHPPPSSPAQDCNFLVVAILCSFILKPSNFIGKTRFHTRWSKILGGNLQSAGSKGRNIDILVMTSRARRHTWSVISTVEMTYVPPSPKTLLTFIFAKNFLMQLTWTLAAITNRSNNEFLQSNLF